MEREAELGLNPDEVAFSEFFSSWVRFLSTEVNFDIAALIAE
jgi:hypothetical protein